MIKWLETRIPPPLLLLLSALSAKALANIFPFYFSFPYQRSIVLLLVVSGLLLAAVAVFQMFRHKTTVNPLRPSKASALLTTGVFSYSRNPVYVADVVLLTAYVLHSGAYMAVVSIPLFIVLVTALQILPEERALTSCFGESYSEYTRRVRRWL